MGGESLFIGRGRFWYFGLRPSSPPRFGCLYGRCRRLPVIGVMEFGRQGQRMFLSSEGALCVAVYSNDPPRAGHLELEVCVVWDGVKASERCMAEQGVIAAAERYDVEDQVLASKVIGRTEHNLQAYRACAPGLNAWDHSFKGSVAGLDP